MNIFKPLLNKITNSDRIKKLEESNRTLWRAHTALNKKHEALIEKMGLSWVVVGYVDIDPSEQYEA